MFRMLNVFIVCMVHSENHLMDIDTWPTTKFPYIKKTSFSFDSPASIFSSSNKLARAWCWGQRWDVCRDGELEAPLCFQGWTCIFVASPPIPARQAKRLKETEYWKDENNLCYKNTIEYPRGSALDLHILELYPRSATHRRPVHPLGWPRSLPFSGQAYPSSQGPAGSEEGRVWKRAKL